MARRRRSLISVFYLSLIFLAYTNAHPRSHVQRQALESAIEKWNDVYASTNASLGTEDLSEDVARLPKSLKGLLQSLSLGLKLFGDALSSLIGDDDAAASGAADPLLTDVPNFGTFVSAISTHASANTSQAYSTATISASITSYLTVKTTRVLTVTASRSAIPVALSSAAAPAVSSPSSISTKPSALTFEKRNLVQVYAGRYPGTTRTLTDLEALCNDADVDIITLAGIYEYFSDTTPQTVPVADFNGLCATAPFAAESGCNALSDTLNICQTVQKKKLFLAVETGTENTTLRSAREARALATLLWDMYGSGKAGARALSQNSLGIVFDGFEFVVNTTTIDDQYFAAVAKAKRDGEVFVPPTLPYFDVLFDELRNLFLAGDTSKPYYLTVSLPCTRPSILSRTALTLVHTVSVRFMDDIGCNINGVAFSNFLSAWGLDMADQSAVDRVGKQDNVPVHESTVTLTSTRLRTTTVRSTQTGGLESQLKDFSRFNVSWNTETETNTNRAVPTNFQILQYDRSGHLITTSGPEPTPLYPIDSLDTSPWFEVSNLERRSDQSAPYFILGIPVPSQETQNATVQSGVGSADPTTLAHIIDRARSEIPKFVGLLLWGGAEDLGAGAEGGYLDFVKRVLDDSSAGNGAAPLATPSIAANNLHASSAAADPFSAPQSRRTVVSNLADLPALWDEIPTPSPPRVEVSESRVPGPPWNEIPTPPPRSATAVQVPGLTLLGSTSWSAVAGSSPTSSPVPTTSASTSTSSLDPDPVSTSTRGSESVAVVVVETSAVSSSSDDGVITTIKSTRLVTRTITGTRSLGAALLLSSSVAILWTSSLG